MLRVGLTGGFACGKSTIANMLHKRGGHTLNADTLAHELYAPGAEVYDAVVGAFGPEIVDPDGTINRARLAAIAFPDRIAELNAIVHPAVIAAQNRWMALRQSENPNGIAVVEAALLIEAGAAKDFDKVMVVTCAMPERIARYAKRAGVSLTAAVAEIERRSNAQMSDNEKARHADYVIDNSGPLEETERQVEWVWNELKESSQNPAEI